MKIVLLILSLFSFFSVKPAEYENAALQYLITQAAKDKTAKSYMMVCGYYVKFGGSEELFYTYLDSAYHAAVKEKSDFWLGQYYYIKSGISANLDSAIVYCDYKRKALFHFEKAGPQASEFVKYGYFSLGLSLSGLQKPDSALYYFRKGLDLKPNSAIRKNIYTGMMYTFRNLAQNDSALIYGEKSNILCTQLKDSSTLCSNLNLMGQIYRERKKFDESLSHLTTAIEIAVNIKEFDNAVSFCQAAAALCKDYAKYDKAVSFLKSGIRYSQKIKRNDLIGNLDNSLGEVYLESGNYNDAFDSFRKSIDYYSKVKDNAKVQFVYSNMMKAFNKSGLHDSAWAYMNKVEKKGELAYIKKDSFPIHFSSVEEKNKQQINDFISEERKTKLDVLKQQYLERENAALKQRFISITIILCLVIATLILLYNRQIQRRKAEKAALYAKEKEAEFIALQKDSELRLTHKYIEGLESERQRMSKELHDGISNDLLALEIELKSIREQNQNLSGIIETLSHTRTNIRNISHELMPPVFQYASLDEMLADYTKHIVKPDTMSIAYQATNDMPWENIPQTTAYEVYRITQELISNSIKHSKAKTVNIKLNLKNDILNLDISDNGIGFDINKKHKGIGLKNITERIKSIGGTLNKQSGNDGTKILIYINISKSDFKSSQTQHTNN